MNLSDDSERSLSGTVVLMARFTAIFIMATLILVVIVAAAVAQPLPDDGPLDAEDLPVSLERIKRRLDRLPDIPKSDEDQNLLRLSFYIEVYGRAHRINIIRNFDVHNGPVPYGSPSHADFLAVTTPREFRAPVANIGPVLGWSLKLDQ